MTLGVLLNNLSLIGNSTECNWRLDSKSVIDDSRSVVNDTKSVIDDSMSIIDDSMSVIYV